MAELIEPMGAETLIHARTRTGSDIRVVVPRDKKGEDRRGAPPRSGSRANPRLRRRRKGGARMSDGDQGNGGMTPAAARKLEYAHHRARRAGAADDLPAVQHHAFRGRLRRSSCWPGLSTICLPLAQPGVPKRSRGEGGDDRRHDLLHCPAGRRSFAAYLYGAFFLKPPDPNTVAGQGSAQRDALVHAQLHMDCRGYRCCLGWPDHVAKSPQGVSPHLKTSTDIDACR